MPKPLTRVAVTGGAGQIAYSLLFRIASGDLFGLDQPLSLHILEIPEMMKPLEGVKMELQDCAFPLLKEIKVGSDPLEIFQDVHFALLVGSKPRGPGMERKDLLTENGKIFVEQGKAINQVANPNVKVLVVGNPCNTNCWIVMKNAPRIPKKNFHAMTRLDQNRATFQLAEKARVSVDEVTNMTIWGNHSSTQVPDYFHAKIKNTPAIEYIKDKSWFDDEFLPIVQKRGAAIIEARGKSSAASAAQAAIDAMKAIITPTLKGEWFSSGICSDGNPYGIEEDLIFSFPCRADGTGDCQRVTELEINAVLKERMKKTEKELIEERAIVKGIFGIKIGVS